ncbi:hypothetical protein ACTXT7_014862 [Hymenolepis weldensis]
MVSILRYPSPKSATQTPGVLTLNLASLYCGSAVSIMTSITQITAAAKRSLINQLPPHSSTTLPGGHNSSNTASTSSPHPLSNLQGVVIFAPRFDQLLSRLSAIQSQYLVERLLGVLATNSTSGVNFGRRLVLVATVKSLSPTALALPPPPATEEVGKPLSTTASPQKASGAALSVRVPTTTNNTIPALLNQRPLVNSNSSNNPMYFNNLNSQESPVVLNGHAPPKTVSMLREQQSPPPGSSGYLNNNVVTTTTNLSLREFSESSVIFESGDLSITSIHCDVEAQTENLPLGSSTTAAAAAAPSGVTVDTLLRRVLRFPYVEKISLSPPVYSLRRKYLQSALLDWLEGKAHESAGFDLEAAAKRLPRPPTPKPVQAASQEPTAIASILDQSRQTRAAIEEAKAIENRDRLLRRFRMALRNFLNNIRRDRRFTAFLRPVSKEDAPDYNRIIRRPMSISQIRTKIDNDEYMSVEPFKQDLKLICTNALEYNPQDERAYEFQDAVDEAFDDDTTLTELSEALAEVLTACPLPSRQNSHAVEAVGNGSQKNSSSPSSGRRYSRRLHGEQPTFGEADLLQLAKRKGSSVKGNDNEEVIPDDAPTPRAEMDQQSVMEDQQPSNLPIDLVRWSGRKMFVII